MYIWKGERNYAHETFTIGQRFLIILKHIMYFKYKKIETANDGC